MTRDQSVWPTRAVGALVAAAVLGVATMWALTFTPRWRIEQGAVVVGAADGSVVTSGVATSGSCPSILDGLVRGDDDANGVCDGPPSPWLVVVPASGAVACGVFAVRWRHREAAEADDRCARTRAAPSSREGSAAVSLTIGAVALGLVGAALWAATVPGETQEWVGGAPIVVPGQPTREPVPLEITQCPSMLDDLLDRGYDGPGCEPGGNPGVVVVGLVGGVLAATGAWRTRPRGEPVRAAAGV